MNEEGPGKISVKKLIVLLRKIKGKRPRPGETDYSRWNQTESEYQQEQARWLESVKQKKETKGTGRDEK